MTLTNEFLAIAIWGLKYEVRNIKVCGWHKDVAGTRVIADLDFFPFLTYHSWGLFLGQGRDRSTGT